MLFHHLFPQHLDPSSSSTPPSSPVHPFWCDCYPSNHPPSKLPEAENLLRSQNVLEILRYPYNHSSSFDSNADCLCWVGLWGAWCDLGGENWSWGSHPDDFGTWSDGKSLEWAGFKTSLFTFLQFVNRCFACCDSSIDNNFRPNIQQSEMATLRAYFNAVKWQKYITTISIFVPVGISIVSDGLGIGDHCYWCSEISKSLLLFTMVLAPVFEEIVVLWIGRKDSSESGCFSESWRHGDTKTV